MFLRFIDRWLEQKFLKKSETKKIQICDDEKKKLSSFFICLALNKRDLKLRLVDGDPFCQFSVCFTLKSIYRVRARK